jgi:hypothetical protein
VTTVAQLQIWSNVQHRCVSGLYPSSGIPNTRKHNVSETGSVSVLRRGEEDGWQHHIGENWHNRATTSGGEYSITTEDGRVKPKHDLIEFKK